MRHLIRAGLVTLIAGVTFIACSSGGATPTATTAAGGGGGAKTASVTMKGFAFGPATVTIAKGGSVTFTNNDGTTHTVSSGTAPNKDGKFDKEVAGGSETTITLDTPGTYTYFCNIHQTMKGTIVVNP